MNKAGVALIALAIGVAGTYLIAVRPAERRWNELADQYIDGCNETRAEALGTIDQLDSERSPLREGAVYRSMFLGVPLRRCAGDPAAVAKALAAPIDPSNPAAAAAALREALKHVPQRTTDDRDSIARH